MRAIVASDNQTTSTKLRHALVQLGYECLIADVQAVDEAARKLETTDRQPDLVLIVLPDDEERCLQQLKRFSESTPARIIAVGAGNDPQRILSAVHAGADDYLVENQDLYQQLSSFLSRLTAKRETASTGGQLTIVASAGGGCGASVIAGNLAVLVAKERGNCALLDFDARSGDQAALFNLKPRYTLAEVCRSIDGCDQNMLKQSLTEHESGVLLLAGPQRLADIGCLSADGLKKVARIARSVMVDVVVDLGSVADGGDVELLRTADQIVLAFRNDFPSLRRARMVVESWDDAQIGRHVVQLVANSCGQAKQLPLAKVQSALRREVLLSLPDDRQGLNLSVDSGNPIVLEAPKSVFSKSMAELGVLAGMLSEKGGESRGSRVESQSIRAHCAFWLSTLRSRLSTSNS
jgi:pilus assembly protein CpaE